ncbi:MAG: ABC transporter ATP-binding protein [Planctomycetota bacterium]|jgi:putative ABC transport system ATP-binding protein
MTALVELHAVTRSYVEGGRTRDVLQSLDLVIERGSKVALLGRSGSGKSTLLSLLAGIDPPTTGEVRIAGTNLATLDETARTVFRRQHIGMVFQAFHLVPVLTVLENVLLPIELERRPTSRDREFARELLTRTGLADRTTALPERLSGGEQQRVALARALIHDPALLVADEPTGNLDAQTAEQVLDLLGELCDDGRRTLVLATHSTSCAARCDRVLRIVDGHVEEAGPPTP